MNDTALPNLRCMTIPGVDVKPLVAERPIRAIKVVVMTLYDVDEIFDHLMHTTTKLRELYMPYRESPFELSL